MDMQEGRDREELVRTGKNSTSGKKIVLDMPGEIRGNRLEIMRKQRNVKSLHPAHKQD